MTASGGIQSLETRFQGPKVLEDCLPVHRV